MDSRTRAHERRASCDHSDSPLHGLGYVSWNDKAERLRAQGWEQKQCGECGLWAIWTEPGSTEAGRAAVEFMDGPDGCPDQDGVTTTRECRAGMFDAFRAGWKAREALHGRS